MRKIIIGVVALLLIGGGGTGAYFYFMPKAEAAADPAAADGHAKVAKKGGHGEKPTTTFVELDPMILPIIDNTGVTQTVSLVVALEVADKEAAAEVEFMKPKLKDAFIQDMYGILNRHAALKGGVIQIAAIKERLNKVSANVMGEGVIQDVLLQVVQQRPI